MGDPGAVTGGQSSDAPGGRTAERRTESAGVRHGSIGSIGGQRSMRIKETAIDGFGKFHNFHTELSDGIQVIYGKNETGKTTLRQFMFHMLFGLEKSRGAAASRDDYTRYMPVEGGRYGGYLLVEKEGQRYRIQRTCETGNRQFCLFLEATMEESTLPKQSLQGVLFENSAESFQNTASLTQADIRTGKEMQKILQNSMA